MKQYIDKSALVAEIEKRIDEVNQIDKASYEVGLFDAYKNILSFLDTLEVKEIGVDLGDPKGDIGVKWVQEEPVSNDLEEACKEWLKPQLDKSYESYGEGKMMELTHFDGYAMLDAIEFGAQWQKEQIIDKACEWLRTNYEDIGIRYIRGHKVEDEIESFKKAMEE